jgi:hypothetical protein
MNMARSSLTLFETGGVITKPIASPHLLRFLRMAIRCLGAQDPQGFSAAHSYRAILDG